MSENGRKPVKKIPPNLKTNSEGNLGDVYKRQIGSGVQYESRVSLGYLNQSFQNAVMEGVLYGCEQGLYGCLLYTSRCV